MSTEEVQKSSELKDSVDEKGGTDEVKQVEVLEEPIKEQPPTKKRKVMEPQEPLPIKKKVSEKKLAALAKARKGKQKKQEERLRVQQEREAQFQMQTFKLSALETQVQGLSTQFTEMSQHMEPMQAQVSAMNTRFTQIQSQVHPQQSLFTVPPVKPVGNTNDPTSSSYYNQPVPMPVVPVTLHRGWGSNGIPGHVRFPYH